jgi:uncharacterized membrane protein
MEGGEFVLVWGFGVQESGACIKILSILFASLEFMDICLEKKNYIYHESYMFFFGVNRFRERTKDTWLIPAVYSSGIIARGDGFYPYLLFQTVTFKQSNL